TSMPVHPWSSGGRLRVGSVSRRPICRAYDVARQHACQGAAWTMRAGARRLTRRAGWKHCAAMDSLDSCIRTLPCWQGDITISPLHGGLSNENFLVVDDAGKHVVRFGNDFPFHHVYRERERMTARAAYEAGFAPALEFAQPGVMVSQFLGAKTYGPEDVRANIGRVAALMRGFHTTMPFHVTGAGFIFWVFHVIRDYARTLEAGNSRKVAD